MIHTWFTCWVMKVNSFFKLHAFWTIMPEESYIKEKSGWNERINELLFLICNFGPALLHSSLTLLIFFSGPVNSAIIRKDKPAEQLHSPSDQRCWVLWLVLTIAIKKKKRKSNNLIPHNQNLLHHMALIWSGSFSIGSRNFIASNFLTSPWGYVRPIPPLPPSKRIPVTFSFPTGKLSNTAIKLDEKQISTNKIYRC